jgi:hypothetical protein
MLAQQQPEEQLLMYWIGGVGCQEVLYQDPRDVKAYQLLIQSGICLKVCTGTTMQFNLSPSFQGTTYSNPIWNINPGVGGQIINQNGYFCTIKWGSGVGSVDANVNTANGILDLQDLCVELIKNPLAAFTLAPNQTALSPQDLRVCSLETFFFNNLSNANGGSVIEDYLWDFGDGQTSSEQNPTHVYTNPGSYTIKLTIYNGCNCSNTSVRKIEVSQKGLDITCAAVVCEGQRATYSVPLNVEFGCER